MSAMPLELESGGLRTLAHRSAFEDAAAGTHEYTRLHREAWPLLVRETASETLLPQTLKSWVRLWGRFGAELFDRFWSGDRFVRSDMISLARREGGQRGVAVAQKLEKCRTAPAADDRGVSHAKEMTSLSNERGGLVDECPKSFDELAEKLKRRFERLADVEREMQRELEEWGKRLDETERRLSRDGQWLNGGGRRL